MWKAVEVGDWIAARKTSLEEARATVTEVIGRVRKDGDSALRQLSRHVELKEIRVSNAEREAAYDAVPRRSPTALPMPGHGSSASTASRSPATSGSRRSSPASSSG